MELTSWIKNYLTSRDAMEQLIVTIEDTDNDFIVHKKTGDIRFLIRPELIDISEFKTLPEKCGLVILNSRKNLDFVITHWQTFAALKDLCIYFVNPVVNQKWLLCPYTHNQITERNALKRGLFSLFSMAAAV